jgi:SRSO17 transposase
VRVADVPTQRIRDMGNQHMPGDEAWLIGERRKYYLSNLPANTRRSVLAGTIKARRICRHAHQQLNEELGLDHFEGQSWHRLHRRLATVKLEKKSHRTTATAKLAGGASCHHRSYGPRSPSTMSALPQIAQLSVNSSAKSAKVVVVQLGVTP